MLTLCWLHQLILKIDILTTVFQAKISKIFLNHHHWFNQLIYSKLIWYLILGYLYFTELSQYINQRRKKGFVELS